jgi:hypothetical protein
MTVGVRSILPVDGVHLLLENDLDGDKVMINPSVKTPQKKPWYLPIQDIEKLLCFVIF